MAVRPTETPPQEDLKAVLVAKEAKEAAVRREHHRPTPTAEVLGRENLVQVAVEETDSRGPKRVLPTTPPPKRMTSLPKPPQRLQICPAEEQALEVVVVTQRPGAAVDEVALEAAVAVESAAACLEVRLEEVLAAPAIVE